MKLKAPICNLLVQLQNIIHDLTSEQYNHKIDELFQATIGQHTRHILEFFIELNKGYLNGIINYDNRKRNRSIESDKDYAIQTISEIAATLTKPDKDLLLEILYGDSESTPVRVCTNYTRELIFNLEHIIHHMALIRIGIQAISDLKIPEDFGIAPSTLHFKKSYSL